MTTVNEALENLQAVIAKHGDKAMLKLGELKEVQDAQNELLLSLAEVQ